MQSSKDYLTVFTPFLELLRSPSPITLSQETLLGAITHFLSTLPSHDLISFTSTLVESPSLWKSDTRRQEELRHAIRLGVPAKVNGANHELRNSYFLRIKQQRSARRWLSDVSKAMMTSKASTGRNVALVGLLEGLSDVSNVDWGRSRVRVEEEIILGLSSIQSDQDEKTQQELKLVCASILYIAEERVRVLDLKVRISASIASVSRDSVTDHPAVHPSCSLSVFRANIGSLTKYSSRSGDLVRDGRQFFSSAQSSNHGPRSRRSFKSTIRLERGEGLLRADESGCD